MLASVKPTIRDSANSAWPSLCELVMWVAARHNVSARHYIKASSLMLLMSINQSTCLIWVQKLMTMPESKKKIKEKKQKLLVLHSSCRVDKRRVQTDRRTDGETSRRYRLAADGTAISWTEARLSSDSRTSVTARHSNTTEFTLQLVTYRHENMWHGLDGPPSGA